MSSILIKPIEDKSVVWFSKTNSYVVVSNETRDIISLLNNRMTVEEIANRFSKKLSIPAKELTPIIKKIEKELYLPNSENIKRN